MYTTSKHIINFNYYNDDCGVANNMRICSIWLEELWSYISSVVLTSYSGDSSTLTGMYCKILSA